MEKITKLERWLFDQSMNHKTSMALLDYKDEILTPTGSDLKDWDCWTDEHKENFINWMESKMEDYGWGSYVNQMEVK